MEMFISQLGLSDLTNIDLIFQYKWLTADSKSSSFKIPSSHNEHKVKNLVGRKSALVNSIVNNTFKL